MICLLEFVRDLPRTAANIAAFLVDAVGQNKPAREVEAALQRLSQGQFIRQTDEGWKLQTAQEKTWERKRAEYLEPRQRDRREVLRNFLRDIFSEPELKTYRYQNLRSFRLRVQLEDTPLLEEGELELHLAVADDLDAFSTRVEEVRQESRERAREQAVFWVFCLTPEIDRLIAEYYASQRMVQTYEEQRAQKQLSPVEAALLQEEKNRLDNLAQQLRTKLSEALSQGSGMFRGVQDPGGVHDAGTASKSFSEKLKRLLAAAVPRIYPQLSLATFQPSGTEVERILQAHDLRDVAHVLRALDAQAALVKQQEGHFVLDMSAPLVKEVLGYLETEHSYGNREKLLGKEVEQHCRRPPYGWDPEIVRLVLATLFRARKIEVLASCQRLTEAHDPMAVNLFAKPSYFRQAAFIPRRSLDVQVLKQTAQVLEHLTGQEVRAEETHIATVAKQFAQETLDQLMQLRLQVNQYRLPIARRLDDYAQLLRRMSDASGEDRVRLLDEHGQHLLHLHRELRRYRDQFTEAHLQTFQRARLAVEQIWPQLARRDEAAPLQAGVRKLEDLLQSERVLEQWDVLQEHTERLWQTYQRVFLDLFDRRAAAYREALEHIQNHADYQALAQRDCLQAERMVQALRERLGRDQERADVAQGVRPARTSLEQLESDLAAVRGFRDQVLERLRACLTPETPTTREVRVRLADLVPRRLQSSHDLEAFLDQLRRTVQRHLDQGCTVIVE